MNSLLTPYIEEFHLLTHKQLEYVSNGCGPKCGPLGYLVPDFGNLYTDACNLHDWIYYCGGSEYIRCLADNRLKNDMEIVTSSLSWWRRRLCFWVPRLYFSVVRGLGRAAFYYASYRRTIHDLEVEMRNV